MQADFRIKINQKQFHKDSEHSGLDIKIVKQGLKWTIEPGFVGFTFKSVIKAVYERKLVGFYLSGNYRNAKVICAIAAFANQLWLKPQLYEFT